MPHISDLETLWRSPYRFWCCSCCGFVIQDTRHHVADPRALPPLRFRRGIDLRRVQMCVSWCCPCPRWMSWCLMCGHDGGPAPSSNSLSGYASSSPSPKFNLCLGPPRQAQSQEVPLCSSGHNIHLLAVPFWIFSCKKQKPRQNIFCCTVFWRTFLVF